METIAVRAEWDDEAGVWIAEGANLPDGFGLATEAATLEALEAKLPGMVQDLLGQARRISIWPRSVTGI